MNDDLQVPWIRIGTGETPVDGGCVMQMVDWIARGKWTDDPPCVHPVIRSLAIEVNDWLADSERQQLLDLIPRMIHTAGGDEALTRKLFAYLARRSYPLYSAWAERADYDDGGAVMACIEAAERGEAARAAGAARAAKAAKAAGAARAAWAASDYLGLLTGLLDRYDEITGRTETEPVDLAPVCEVMSDRKE